MVDGKSQVGEWLAETWAGHYEKGDDMALPKGIDGKGRVMKGGDGDRPFNTNASPTARELRRKEERRLKKLKKDEPLENEPVEQV